MDSGDKYEYFTKTFYAFTHIYSLSKKIVFVGFV